MEQKKTLWIIAAVSAFLLVVLGAACILYFPNTKPYSTVASVSPVEKHPQTTQSSGWTNPTTEQINNVSPTPVYPQDTTTATKVNDMIVVSDNTTVYGMNNTLNPASVTTSEGTTIDLNALKRELYQETPTVAQPQNINITVNIPETTKETTTVITSTPEYRQEPSKNVSSPVSPVKVVEKSKTVEEKKVAKTTVTTKTTTKTTTKASSAPAPAPKKQTQFWVQVAAYSNKKGAEGARLVLDENKIPADIFTYKDNKENLFYRVRVGPYTTKSEAEYWRSKIVKIDEFSKAESFVTSTN